MLSDAVWSGKCCASTNANPIQRTARTPPNWPCEKECNISIQCTKMNDEPVGMLANLCGRFAVRTTIPKHIPVRPHFSNIHRALPFIIAIIPFRKVRFYFGGFLQPNQLTCFPCTLKRTSQHMSKRNVPEVPTQFREFVLAVRR